MMRHSLHSGRSLAARPCHMNGSGQNLQMRHDVCYPLPHERERAESADEASSLFADGLNAARERPSSSIFELSR